MFFDERVENAVFCDVFVTRRLKCIVNTSVFFTFITSSSQSKPSKNTGICSVLTRQNAKKTRCLEAIFRDFSPVPRKSKINDFLPEVFQIEENTTRVKNTLSVENSSIECLTYGSNSGVPSPVKFQKQGVDYMSFI